LSFPRRHWRIRNRKARDKALSKAVRQSRATDATTTVPATSLLISTWQRLSRPPRGPLTSEQLDDGLRDQPVETTEHEARAALSHIPQFVGLRITRFEKNLHHSSPLVEV